MIRCRIFQLSNYAGMVNPMHLVKLHSKNQITLPGKVVALAGLKEGDLLNVAHARASYLSRRQRVQGGRSCI